MCRIEYHIYGCKCRVKIRAKECENHKNGSRCCKRTAEELTHASDTRCPKHEHLKANSDDESGITATPVKYSQRGPASQTTARQTARGIHRTTGTVRGRSRNSDDERLAARLSAVALEDEGEFLEEGEFPDGIELEAGGDWETFQSRRVYREAPQRTAQRQHVSDGPREPPNDRGQETQEDETSDDIIRRWQRRVAAGHDIALRKYRAGHPLEAADEVLVDTAREMGELSDESDESESTVRLTKGKGRQRSQTRHQTPPAAPVRPRPKPKRRPESIQVTHTTPTRNAHPPAAVPYDGAVPPTFGQPPPPFLGFNPPPHDPYAPFGLPSPGFFPPSPGHPPLSPGYFPPSPVYFHPPPQYPNTSPYTAPPVYVAPPMPSPQMSTFVPPPSAYPGAAFGPVLQPGFSGGHRRQGSGESGYYSSGEQGRRSSGDQGRRSSGYYSSGEQGRRFSADQGRRSRDQSRRR